MYVCMYGRTWVCVLLLLSPSQYQGFALAGFVFAFAVAIPPLVAAFFAKERSRPVVDDPTANCRCCGVVVAIVNVKVEVGVAKLVVSGEW
jgi:hypothetical protein